MIKIQNFPVVRRINKVLLRRDFGFFINLILRPVQFLLKSFKHNECIKTFIKSFCNLIYTNF